MKKMNKVFAKGLSSLLVLSMVLGTTTTAFAAEAPIKVTFNVGSAGSTKHAYTDANGVIGDNMPTFYDRDGSEVVYKWQIQNNSFDNLKNSTIFDEVYELTCKRGEHRHSVENGCYEVKEWHECDANCYTTEKSHVHTDDCYTWTHTHNDKCAKVIACSSTRYDIRYGSYKECKNIDCTRTHYHYVRTSYGMGFVECNDGLKYACGEKANTKSSTANKCTGDLNTETTVKKCTGELNKSSKTLKCRITENWHDKDCYAKKTLTTEQVKNLTFCQNGVQFDAVAVEKTIPAVYTVRFYDEDGKTLLATEKVEKNSVVTAPKASDKDTAEWDYTFAGWVNKNSCDRAKVTDKVTHDVDFVATYTKVKNQYTYTFKNDNGTVLKTLKADYGTAIVAPAAPTKAATAEYTYTFAGWDKEVAATLTANVEYTATYSATKNQYTVTFKPENGSANISQKDDFGTAIEVPADPSKTATAEFTYTFAGWLDKVGNVVTSFGTIQGDAEYTATYSATKNQYTYTFKDEDGTVLKTLTADYGTVIGAPETNPTKAADNTYTYEFAGWDKQVADTLTADVEYTAIYDKTFINYTVTFVDEDGKVLSEKTDYHYGDDLVVAEEPSKEATAQYTYTFAGWDNEIKELVEENATYTATYTETVNQYTVTFVDEDGSTVLGDVQTVDYGTLLAEVVRPTATKAADDQYTYAFANWVINEDGAAILADQTVMGNIVLRATYTATEIPTEVLGEQFENPEDTNTNDDDESAVLGAEFGATGDNMPIFVMVGLFVMSGLAAAGLAFKKREEI